MSYQVLARKWRPRTFAELSGQAHVVTALSNALTRGRLHHAYLLTGTRGVGKTTIARILAKSLNCVTGVTATPCGVCAACTEIDAGRFVDLLELDAASNTGIDNMREILDNARYAPTAGRYKVYLIDEVHMLSKAAFNSMLKTLEEPPDHVKFVLATTDPQKIPVTVLSRCLQFNLKPLPPATIEARLGFILGEEGIASDAAGLALIARAAQGSLRDALSLLDQAIAFGGGEVREAVVRPMLGAVDRDHVYRIVDALLARDGAALLAQADALAERGLAFGVALEELASLFHRVAVAQVVPTAVTDYDDATAIERYRTALTPDMVQLAYQICAQGRADLALAPDEATGFAMTLLRLLAFEPDAAVQAAPPVAPRTAPAIAPAGARASVPASSAPAATPAAPPRSSLPPELTAVPERGLRPESPATGVGNVSGLRAAAPRAGTEPASPRAAATVALPDDPAQWPATVAAMNLTGMAAQLAAQSEWVSLRGNALTLALPVSHRHLADKVYADKLKTALEQATGRKLLLAFEVGDSTAGSLAAQKRKAMAEAQANGEQAFREEPFVQALITRFDARLKPETITPLPGADGTAA